MDSLFLILNILIPQNNATCNATYFDYIFVILSL